MSETRNAPIVVIACGVMQALMQKYLPEDQASQVIYTDMGLHETPAKLTVAVQEAIDAIEEPSLVVLGYGLCGNGLAGVQAKAHTLLIPRTDDCVALFMGSYDAYSQEMSNAGTYFLTKGWLESNTTPVGQYESYRQKYSEDDVDYMMDMQFQHYDRLLFVAPNKKEAKEYRGMAQEVAEFCQRWQMAYEEYVGSDDYFKALIDSMHAPEEAGSEFVLIPPGGEIKTEQFFRS
jgi:hypothetical protein